MPTPGGGACCEPVEHPGAVRPAIDVVADMDQRDRGGGPAGDVLGDDPMHRAEPIEAAMHVADGIDPLAVRQRGGGAGEGDHAALHARLCRGWPAMLGTAVPRGG